VHGELLRNKRNPIGHVSCANSLPIGIYVSIQATPLPPQRKKDRNRTSSSAPTTMTRESTIPFDYKFHHPQWIS